MTSMEEILQLVQRLEAWLEAWLKAAPAEKTEERLREAIQLVKKLQELRQWDAQTILRDWPAEGKVQ